MSNDIQTHFDAYLKGLKELRKKLEKLRPSQQHLHNDMLTRLNTIEPQVRALPLEEFHRTWLRPPPGSTLHDYRLISNDIRSASDPRTEISDCVEGGLYRLHCRNSNCGIWLPAQAGFQIARTKFDDTYIFVEIHVDAGGTARPYEMLDHLSSDADPAARLALLLRWRGQLGAY